MVSRRNFIKGAAAVGGMMILPSWSIGKQTGPNSKLNVALIGVGGITDAEKAGEMMNAGASLVQIYTGMVYRGPFFARSLANSLLWRDCDWV